MRRLVAEHLDVERAAAGQVEHPLPQLRRAGTASSGSGCRRRPPWPGASVGAALRAVRRHHELALGRRRAASTTGPSTSGMTSPALRITTVSPISTPLRLTSDGVVQGGQADRGAGDLDRLHVARTG